MSKFQSMHPTHEDIATQAYALWLEDGCPEGAQEEHWHRAEELLKATKKKTTTNRNSGAIRPKALTLFRRSARASFAFSDFASAT